MRLYLSSFRLGDHPARLVAMTAGTGRVAVLGHAMDTAPADVRAAAIADEIHALAGLGLDPVEVDLRVDDPAGLASYQAVWVRGGNTFVLREALARSGADAVLTGLVRADALVYAGYSAGGCVLAPSLRGLELCDDPGEADHVSWDGLGVLDHALVPHLDSPGHPETDLVAAVAARYERDGTPYVGLRDGQVLVVDGTTTEVL